LVGRWRGKASREKKTVVPTERDRPSVVGARERFADEVRAVTPSRFVFLDETGTHTYMTPYSPDLNAIELCWSKFKGFLKAIGARKHATLREAIGRVAREIRAPGAVAWNHHFLAQLE
jgi:transposase